MLVCLCYLSVFLSRTKNYLIFESGVSNQQPSFTQSTPLLWLGQPSTPKQPSCQLLLFRPENQSHLVRYGTPLCTSNPDVQEPRGSLGAVWFCLFYVHFSLLGKPLHPNAFWHIPQKFLDCRLRKDNNIIFLRGSAGSFPSTFRFNIFHSLCQRSKQLFKEYLTADVLFRIWHAIQNWFAAYTNAPRETGTRSRVVVVGGVNQTQLRTFKMNAIGGGGDLRKINSPNRAPAP